MIESPLLEHNEASKEDETLKNGVKSKKMSKNGTKTKPSPISNEKLGPKSNLNQQINEEGSLYRIPSIPSGQWPNHLMPSCNDRPNTSQQKTNA